MFRFLLSDEGQRISAEETPLLPLVPTQEPASDIERMIRDQRGSFLPIRLTLGLLTFLDVLKKQQFCPLGTLPLAALPGPRGKRARLVAGNRQVPATQIGTVNRLSGAGGKQFTRTQPRLPGSLKMLECLAPLASDLFPQETRKLGRNSCNRHCRPFCSGWTAQISRYRCRP